MGTTKRDTQTAQYDPQSNGAADYRQLAEEVLGLNQPPIIRPASPLDVTINKDLTPARIAV